MTLRENNISTCLTQQISKDLSKICCNYDYFFNGKSTLLGYQQYFICCIEVLPCGKIISGNGVSIKIWDQITFECLDQIKCWDECYDCIGMCICALSDEYIVCASKCDYESDIMIWNLVTRKCESVLKSHTGPVHCIKIINENQIISGSEDLTIKIWNFKTQKCIKTYNDHKGGIRVIEILSDQRVVSGDTLGKIKIWDLLSQICVLTLDAHDKIVTTIAVFSDGHFISGSEDKMIKIWLPTENTKNDYYLDITFTEHTDEISDIIRLPDDRFISCSDPNVLKLWSHTTANYEVMNLKHDDDECEYILYFPHPDGRIISGSSEGMLCVWN